MRNNLLVFIASILAAQYSSSIFTAAVEDHDTVVHESGLSSEAHFDVRTSYTYTSENESERILKYNGCILEQDFLTSIRGIRDQIISEKIYGSVSITFHDTLGERDPVTLNVRVCVDGMLGNDWSSPSPATWADYKLGDYRRQEEPCLPEDLLSYLEERAKKYPSSFNISASLLNKIKANKVVVIEDVRNLLIFLKESIRLKNNSNFEIRRNFCFLEKTLNDLEEKLSRETVYDLLFDTFDILLIGQFLLEVISSKQRFNSDFELIASRFNKEFFNRDNGIALGEIKTFINNLLKAFYDFGDEWVLKMFLDCLENYCQLQEVKDGIAEYESVSLDERRERVMSAHIGDGKNNDDAYIPLRCPIWAHLHWMHSLPVYWERIDHAVKVRFITVLKRMPWYSYEYFSHYSAFDLMQKKLGVSDGEVTRLNLLLGESIIKPLSEEEKAQTRAHIEKIVGGFDFQDELTEEQASPEL